ncbi:hypothetical protein ACIQXF_19160 [Lysinibacillus sp. NPDC097231]|uniref:hypothetical protein n=1 Tax=Lysinibacillus sp. NPDC097231 TaxID=3364142 RepID=UPI003807115F
MLFILGIFIMVGVLESITLHLTRKTTVFGVSIPEPYVRHPQLRLFGRKHSRLWELGFSRD